MPVGRARGPGCEASFPALASRLGPSAGGSPFGKKGDGPQADEASGGARVAAAEGAPDGYG